ncbi:6-bladed beta-propeller [Roseivirga sp. E12]|uniref:6-bladed beta-propeller n=1 Tax=Roseivirga sp. E12 TaxID=2819237 RepID=UPI001ABC3DFF|nr:6-bladed beta-propeller [Roseivirga sp. E12]MBO3700402.1 6-bladed beta-propeller [Roseivirga sp. E12]
MTRKTFYAILVSTSLIAGCYSGNNIDDRLNTERMKNFTLVASSPRKLITSEAVELYPSQIDRTFGNVSEVFLNRSYIELNTPSHIIIGRVSKMKMSNGYILILDDRISKSAFLFRENGDFLFEVGVQGQGPDEHDELIDIEFRDSRILLMDRGFRVSEYDLNNRFIARSEIPFFSHSMFLFEDGKMAFSNNTTGYGDLNYQIIFLEGPKISDRFLRNEGTAMSKYTSQPLTSNQSVHQDSFLFFQPWGVDIFQMSGDSVELRYKIVSDNQVPTFLLQEGRNLESRQHEYTFLFNWPILESQKHVLFRVLHKGAILTLIHDKSTNKFSGYNGISDDLLYGGVSDFPIYVKDNHFYIPLEVEQLYAVKKELSGVKDKKLLRELKSARPEVFRLLEGVNELSNPIIMKCEIR